MVSVRATSMPSSTDMTVDMDKMVSIKGLVIRTTPVIPDMKTGEMNSIQSYQNLKTNKFPSFLPMPGLQSCRQRFP